MRIIGQSIGVIRLRSHLNLHVAYIIIKQKYKMTDLLYIFIPLVVDGCLLRLVQPSEVRGITIHQAWVRHRSPTEFSPDGKSAHMEDNFAYEKSSVQKKGGGCRGSRRAARPPVRDGHSIIKFKLRLVGKLDGS